MHMCRSIRVRVDARIGGLSPLAILASWESIQPLAPYWNVEIGLKCTKTQNRILTQKYKRFSEEGTLPSWPLATRPPAPSWQLAHWGLHSATATIHMATDKHLPDCSSGFSCDISSHYACYYPLFCCCDANFNQLQLLLCSLCSVRVS